MSLIYITAIDMITLLQKLYNGSLLVSAKVAITKNMEEDIQEHPKLLFASADSPNTQSNDITSVHTTAAVNCNAPFTPELNNASSCVWSTPKCRPTQIAAVETILFEQKCKCKPLVVDQSGGGGESHILRMISTMNRCIILVIVLLLKLTAAVF